MQGPASFVVLQAQQLQISANGVAGNGIFVYNPSPGPGNLVGAWVAVAGPDIFGNNALQGISVINTTFGTTAQLNAASLNFFAGATQRVQLNNNGLSIFNSSGALVYTVDLTRDATFLYTDTGSATQGKLIASDTNAGGTDSFGNTTYAGRVNYDSALASIIQLLTGQMKVGTPAQMNGTGGASPGIFGLAANQAGSIEIDTGLTATGDTDAAIVLLSANRNSGQRAVSLQGPLVLSPETTPAQPGTASNLWANSLGYTRTQSSNAGDTNAYGVGETAAVLSANFTINSTTAQVILSRPVGGGLYRIEVWLVVNNNVTGAAGEAIFQLLGPTASSQLVDFKTTTTGTATVGYGANATNYQATFPDQGVNVPQQVLMRAVVNFSASGTLQLTGKETTAGDTITVFQNSFMSVRPA